MEASTPLRRHLVAVPRGRPRPAPGHRHLVAIPRGRPGTARIADVLQAEDPAPPRASRSLIAVLASLMALALLCCGAAVSLHRLTGAGDPVPPAPPNVADVSR